MRKQSFFNVLLSILVFVLVFCLQTLPVQSIVKTSSALPQGIQSPGGCGSMLFSDDFNDGTADGWTTRLDGTWSVENLQYRVDMGSGQELRGETLAGDTAWTDYTFEADVIADEGCGKDFLYRYIDENNYYSTSLIEIYDYINIVKVENGIASTLEMFEYPQEENTWYHVLIKLEGNQIDVTVNGDPAISHHDTGSSLVYGKIGFQGYTGQYGVLQTRFDNAVVRGLCHEYGAYLPLVVR
jgi:hypothetical protein